MSLTRVRYRLGTTAATALFALTVVAVVLFEYVLFVGVSFVVLTILLSYFADWLALLLVSAVLGTFPVGYHAYHVLEAEPVDERSVVRAFENVVDDLEDGTWTEAGRADLRERVEELTCRADVPTPTVVTLETTVPLTAAVGYRRSETSLLVSSGVYDSLDEAELEAVLVHELAHLESRDAARMTAMTAPWTTARVNHGSERALSFFTGVPGAAGRFCSIVIGRVREHVADDRAVEVTGEPAALASALETLEDRLEEESVGALRSNPTLVAFSILPLPEDDRTRFDPSWYRLTRRLVGSHPPTERRLERLRATAFRLRRRQDTLEDRERDDREGSERRNEVSAER